MYVISEIFLHVGLHKTGTKSNQDTLFSKTNSEFLEDSDYYQNIGLQIILYLYTVIFDF